MQISQASRYRIRQVLVITIAWTLIGILVEILNSINIDPASGKYFFHFLFGRSAIEHLLITAIGPLTGGLIAGSFIVFYQREKLKGKTYLRKLLIHSSLYILFLTFFIFTVAVIGALSNPVNEFRESLLDDILSLRVMRLVITWYIIVILTIFLLDVSEKYGAGVLKKQLMGRYHSPVQEDRIFLFLDLKSSTAIAESIGDEKYFRMLRFFYQLANEAIIEFKGEIYQYVGDEIVTSWEREQGLKDANCLRCFTAIQNIVTKNEKEFIDQYGTVPEFKAAIHSGIVTAGEIGIIKKDVVYSGDVLNTTARMMALCKHFQTDLIVSGDIQTEMKDVGGYEFRFLDSTVLRGKKIKMDLFAVHCKN